jgi:acyl-coenzyme A synthetase/AMP-(fatty) acid ligase
MQGWVKVDSVPVFDESFTYICSCAIQVVPAELEEILRHHPAVGDVAVIGLPHERLGEVPKAFIVPKDSKLTADEVKNFVADKVSDYKSLAGGVQFVSSIPKNSSGKILRRKLKEMYCK